MGYILPQGSILKRPIDWGCYHMAIYIGQGLVVHFGGPEKKAHDAVVHCEDLQTCANGRQWSVHAVPVNDSHGAAVCAEAIRLLLLGGANGWNGRYDLLTRNCEHFTTECFETLYR